MGIELMGGSQHFLIWTQAQAVVDQCQSHGGAAGQGNLVCFTPGIAGCCRSDFAPQHIVVLREHMVIEERVGVLVECLPVTLDRIAYRRGIGR